MGDRSRAVEIRSTYWIRPDDKESSLGSSSADPTRIQTFGTASVSTDNYTSIDSPLRVGLSEGVKPEKRPAGDESYSGLHDQGQLPPLIEGGSMAVLLKCLQEAKNFNDQYLTQVISEQKKVETRTSHEKSGQRVCVNPLKKAKVDSGEQ